MTAAGDACSVGSLPRSPRTARGAIVAVDAASPLPRSVAFQYNPDTVTRALRPRGGAVEGGVGAGDAHRMSGAPVETITMKVEIDAADQLERGEQAAGRNGIGDELAALEMLLYPSSFDVLVSAALSLVGTIEILPPESPLTVLVWGPSRTVPIRLESLSIVEDAFDPHLNPIRATVDLSAQVLTYSDLPITDPGYALFLRHQLRKESLADTVARRISVL
ncbi:hypothetical protein [Mycolicibacterium celeriflavum]|uniref:hypothetical protein n=1 Tax=Mycolicibacterium celeriflavum TaxID=1249101 RepID=UPI003CEECB5B